MNARKEDVTSLVWRASGVKVIKDWLRDGWSDTRGCAITLSLTNGPSIIGTGRWEVKRTYHYIGQTSDTLITTDRELAVNTFHDWCKESRAVPYIME